MAPVITPASRGAANSILCLFFRERSGTDQGLRRTRKAGSRICRWLLLLRMLRDFCRRVGENLLRYDAQLVIEHFAPGNIPYTIWEKQGMRPLVKHSKIPDDQQHG